MRELSIFIDESGDFGPYDYHSPYYIIAMVFHDQTADISGPIAKLNRDLEKLTASAISTAETLASRAGVKLTHTAQDVFPATVNAPELYDKVETAAKEAGLRCLTPAEPFRWSEDFGHYGAHCPAFFCGIGAGEDAPGLHTPDYTWNSAVTEAAGRLFSTLIRI